MRDGKGPERSGHYWFPNKASRFVAAALALTAVVVAVFGVLQTAGRRQPLSAGPLVSAHATLDDTCEKCHVGRGRGLSDALCRACHDPAGGDHYTVAAHVHFGGGDSNAAKLQDQKCATCHREHQGRTAVLAAGSDSDCATCHFGSFSQHPEFTAIHTQVRVPGIAFGHQLHIQEVVQKMGVSREESCFKCHDYSGTDFEKLSFDRHCASCHTIEGSLGSVEPISEAVVRSPQAIAALGVFGSWDAEGYETSRGSISKPTVKHRDEWVVYNARSLRADLDPEGHRAERAALAKQVAELEARLSRATTGTGRTAAELEASEKNLATEIMTLDARLRAQASAVEPADSLRRLNEVAEVAEASGEETARAEAARLRTQGATLPRAEVSPALSAEEFERRRAELRELLTSLAEGEPAVRARANELKQRLEGLRYGESSREILVRERERKAAELEQTKRELRLRQESGSMLPGAVVPLQQERVLEEALQSAKNQLASLPPESTARLADRDRDRKWAALEVLTAPCAKCHELKQIPMFHVPAAQPVLTHSAFKHQPHLVQGLACKRCHDGVERSTTSLDVNFQGINVCRDCHRPRQSRQDCQFCHFYHPPEL